MSYQKFEKLKYNTSLPELLHKAFLDEVIHSRSIGKKQRKNKLNKRKVLLKRKNYLNNKFKFTRKNILKFEELSNILTRLQSDVISKYNYIEDKINLEMESKGGRFSDYNINLKILFFCNKIDDDIDLLFQSDEILTGPFKDEETLNFINCNYAEFEDFNEYKRRFAHFHQSRLFHHLLMESYLSLNDILLIDEIWFDIKVDYQSIYKINNF